MPRLTPAPSRPAHTSHDAGSKNKAKNVVSLDGFDSGDLTWGDYPPLPEQPPEKRSRGRPKGSKVWLGRSTAF